MYYKMLIGWTSQQIKDNYAVHNPFDFKHGKWFSSADRTILQLDE
jgi:hypothetical protein